MSRLTPDDAVFAQLETPCLVVDGATLKQNISRMAASARKAGIALRPHAKTHKSVDIARLQLRAGATGIACATVPEADMLAHAGVTGLMITSPVASPDKYRRVARLNREVGLIIAVDHPAQVMGLASAIEPGDRKLQVVVDLDVGQRRTGVTDIDAGVAIARLIARQPQLSFMGIQGFAGHAQHVVDPVERRAAGAAAAAELSSFANALAAEGLPPSVVTGSGTGTYSLDAAGPYTELQVGSYIFMDADYARLRHERAEQSAFAPSLFVLASVVSVNRPGQVTVDAGTKALATNGPPPSLILGAPPGTTYSFAGDEHGIVTVPPGGRLPTLGDRLLIQATHCDPTANLHGCYHVIEAGEITRWSIAARHGG